MEGWIKLHRKILENPIVCKDAETMAIWIYLLLNATHKEIPAVFKGEKIVLQPGQLITGRKSIAKKLDVTESKVQRVLKCYENEHQIEQRVSNANRLITIIKWNEYQDNEHAIEQPMNNQRTTNEQPVNTNKNERMKEYLSYFINIYKDKKPSTFLERMRFLHEIQDDEKYKELTPEEEHSLRVTVLGREE